MDNPNKTPSPTSDRLPPHSIEAERSLLGSVMIDNGGQENLALLSERLSQREHFFYELNHQKLWDSHIAPMARRGDPVDITTLAPRLKVTDDDLGGIASLMEMVDACATPLNFEYYYSECLELWKLRRQLASLTAGVKAIFDPEKKASEIINEVESLILSAGDTQGESSIVTGRQMMDQCLEDLQGYERMVGLKAGLKTGFDYYDKMTTGFYGSEYIVVAGRPGTGKTSWVMDVMSHVCVTQQMPVLFFSLEMTPNQLGHRWYCQRGGVDFQRLRTGYMEDQDMPKVTTAAVEIKDAPIFVDGKSGIDVLEMRSKARRYKRRHNIGLIVIDYVQLVKPPAGRYYQNREQQVAVISQELLAMCKELDVPVIVLAQLNRDIEKAERARPPQLSDLKESGQIEQDAHNVTILYQPVEKSLSDEEQELVKSYDWSNTRRRINARIVKQRNGPTGDCAFTFWKASMHFEEFKIKEARQYVADQSIEG